VAPSGLQRAGGAAWVGLWVLTGYLAGDHIGAIYGEFQRYQKHVVAAVGVIAIAALLRWILKRRSAALDT
jgi:membrane protein DedA with SNARE-associated domain